jgi:hypothetical protein
LVNRDQGGLTIEPSDFRNGHGQNDHFDHAMTTIPFLSSNGHGLRVIINRDFTNFNYKKSGILEMVMIKFGD